MLPAGDTRHVTGAFVLAILDDHQLTHPPAIVGGVCTRQRRLAQLAVSLPKFPWPVTLGLFLAAVEIAQGIQRHKMLRAAKSIPRILEGAAANPEKPAVQST